MAFKSLMNFQKVEFKLELKNDIHYTKFYKEIFNIINYITNIFPLEEYKYNLNPMSVSTGFNIKYTNKLLKEKFSNKI